MVIDSNFFDELSTQAKISNRLRQSFDLRYSEKDNSQRILNALEPGTVIPIHRHCNTSETMILLRGKLIERLYDDMGNLTGEFEMEPCGKFPMIQIEAGQWHSLEVLETGTVIFEAKSGKYIPLGEKYILK